MFNVFIFINLSITSCYAATNIINTETLQVGNDKIEIKEYLDNGKIVTTYSGNKSIFNSVLSSNILSTVSSASDPTGPYEGWGPERVLSAAAGAPTNGLATVEETVYMKSYSNYFDFRLMGYGGITKGWWYGSGNATNIVLRQVYTTTGISFSVSWPASFNISSTTTKYEWVSLAYPNCWLCSAPHDTVTVTGVTAVLGLSIADGSDVYVGQTVYKARSEVSSDWTYIYYGHY